MCSSQNLALTHTYAYFFFSPHSFRLVSFQYYTNYCYYHYKLKHLSSFFSSFGFVSAVAVLLPASIYARNYLIIKLVSKAWKRHKTNAFDSQCKYVVCRCRVVIFLPLTFGIWYGRFFLHHRCCCCCYVFGFSMTRKTYLEQIRTCDEMNETMMTWRERERCERCT